MRVQAVRFACGRMDLWILHTVWCCRYIYAFIIFAALCTWLCTKSCHLFTHETVENSLLERGAHVLRLLCRCLIFAFVCWLADQKCWNCHTICTVHMLQKSLFIRFCPTAVGIFSRLLLLLVLLLPLLTFMFTAFNFH